MDFNNDFIRSCMWLSSKLGSPYDPESGYRDLMRYLQFAGKLDNLLVRHTDRAS